MTISYSGNFFQLLLRWKGSIWRSVWRELLVYLLLFYSVRFMYLTGFDILAPDHESADHWRKSFETFCKMCNDYCKQIPLTFLLGFYVANMVSRWWKQFESVSWPEDVVTTVCTVIPANDEASQQRRHMIARYLNLASVLAWRDVSTKIRLRFPKIQDLIPAGLLTEDEFKVLDEHQQHCEGLRWLAPLHWIEQLLHLEEKENKPVPTFMNTLYNEIRGYRKSLRNLYCYDWVCVPLVYSQVTAMATYAFFLFALFGRQTLISDIEKGNEIDIYVPIFLIVQFLFFVGWFKVGQDLMRPFGLDDDDIELNYILDRNIAISFSILSRLQTAPPPKFVSDVFWQQRKAKYDKLPHTEHSGRIKEHQPKLHSHVNVGDDKNDSKGCVGRWEKHYINW